NRLIRLFAGKKSAQIREILISESAWEEMTCLFAPSLALLMMSYHSGIVQIKIGLSNPLKNKAFFLKCVISI
ncbi:TPA: hypothetical protein MJC33_29300, partial [Klebsiella pneumoniae]|nr:hypothetical protein [Klebsiella pneumoniae]